MSRGKTLLVSAGLLCASVLYLYGRSAHSEPASETDIYRQALRSTLHSDRLQYLLDTLSTDLSPDLSSEVIRDLVQVARDEANNESALTAIEAFLNIAEQGTAVRADAYYARALLLLRVGREEDAVVAFKQGISDGTVKSSGQNPVDSYLIALRESHPRRYAIEQLTYALTSRPEIYLKRRNYLRMFTFSFLWQTRSRFDAVEDIYSALPAAEDGPEFVKIHHEIAKTICLILDEEHIEALAQLHHLDNSLTGGPDTVGSEDQEAFLTSNEKRNIPLYTALAHGLLGDFESLNIALAEFKERNIDDLKYVSHSITKLGFAFEPGPDSEQLVLLELMGFLEGSGFLDDELTRAAIGIREVHKIRSLVMNAHLRLGEWGLAVQSATSLIEECSDHTGAYCDALFGLAYAQRKSGDLSSAEGTFWRLMEAVEADEKWRRVAASQLAALFMDMRRSGEEITDMLDLFADAPKAEEEFYSYQIIRDRYVQYIRIVSVGNPK